MKSALFTRPRGLSLLVAVLASGFLGAVLLPAVRLSGELVASSAALKAIGEQQRYPALIRTSLDAVRERLNNRAYLEDSVGELRAAAGRLDAALPRLTGAHAEALRNLWAQEHLVLDPVLTFKGMPYKDSEASGTLLNEAGRQLDRDLMAAIRTSRHALPLIDQQLADAADEVQSATGRAAQALRLMMLAGLGLALGLAVVVVLLIRARRRQETSLTAARQQTADILRTVKDGLFLLDENLTIGAAHSDALQAMFKRGDLAGLSFEALLKDLVSEKTLATALKYVKVLWSERTKENLVRSINPLGEVEVQLDMGNGRVETRALEFDFHRVRQGGRITQVLVSVSDVTARVELARELQSAQGQAQAQVDTLLGILHIDPQQLASFLSDTNASMAMINAILREPAREAAAFRKKLDTLFRQAHSVKGEAAALGLSSIESRAHSFEEDLKALREKPELSGNDFLPLVIKLDDLLTHLQSIGELVARLAHLQPANTAAASPGAAAAAAERDPHSDTDVIGAVAVADAPPPSPAPAEGGLTGMLKDLAARLAASHDKEVTLECEGFEAIPADYRRAIKDVSVQAVRNALVHGIESPAVRELAGKPRCGRVRLTFARAEDSGFRFTIEDDGRGLAVERIRAVAIERHLVTPEQAAAMTSKQIYGLIFKPGFSTAEVETEDAGRGVGMNLIGEIVQEAGGRVSLGTAEGQYTRFTLTLPERGRSGAATVAA